MRVLFCLFIVCILLGSTYASLNSTQANAVKDFFKKLLQVDDFAVEFGAKPTVERKKMHKHMLELYQHFKDRNIQNNAIIRSIEPLKRFPDMLKNILMFNISSLKPSEKILTSHLHVFRRRISDRITDDGMAWTPLPPCKIRLFQIHMRPDIEEQWKRLNSKVMATWSPVTAKKKRHARGLKTPKGSLRTMKDSLVEIRKEGNEGIKLKPLDVIPVPQLSKGGWYSVEISMGLKEMLNSAVGPMDSLLGVRFEGPRGKSIIPQRFLKEPKDNTSSSFIVISSEDSSPLLNLDYISANKFDLNQENAKLLAEIISSQNTKNIDIEPNLIISKKYDLEKSPDNIENTERYASRVENISENSIKTHNKTFIDHSEKLKPNNELIEKEIINDDDITEKLRISPYPKKNRHNHKNVNSLKIRYDPATNTIVQKKADVIPGIIRDVDSDIQSGLKPNVLTHFISYDKTEKPKNAEKYLTDYFIELSSDEDGVDWNNLRKKRSTEDNDLPTTSLVLASHSDELRQVRPNYIKANSLGTKKEEKPGEDDLGDTLYYEPDVYEHEKMVPIRYQPQYFTSENITEITEEKLRPIKQHKHGNRPTLTVKPRHKEYLRHNKWDIDEPKIREHSLTIKRVKSQQTKYRHKKQPLKYDNYLALVRYSDSNNKNDNPINSQTKTARKRSNQNTKSVIQNENQENMLKNRIYKYTTSNTHDSKSLDMRDDEEEFVWDIDTRLGIKPETNWNQNDRNQFLDDSHKWDKDQILRRIHKYSQVSDELNDKIENARQHLTYNRNKEADRTESSKEKNNGSTSEYMDNPAEHPKTRKQLVEITNNAKPKSNKRHYHRNFEKILQDETQPMLNEDIPTLNGNTLYVEDTLQQYKVGNSKTTGPLEPDQIQTLRTTSPKRKLNILKGAAHQQKPSLINDWKLWDNEWETDSVNPDDSCRKKHFQVSFAELGWGDWIIAPDNFSTNYCAGHCQLSHLVDASKTCDLDSTNHAILQSLIHAINRVSGVPAPCCVPAKMSSKTVLYQDPHGNVLLRNYPNMVVNTCECR